MPPRILLLLRHAKSSWDHPELRDHDRPLSARGRRAATAMGHWLGVHGPWPDLVLSSTSARTRQTWTRLTRAAGRTAQITWSDDIYLASVAALLDGIGAVGEHVRTLMVLGHNPGLHELAALLTVPTPGDPAEERLRRKLPTGALVHLELSVDGWSSLAPATGRLVQFLRPRDLPDPGASHDE